MNALLGPAVSFLVSWGMTAWLASGSSPFRIMDLPGARSLHSKPKPRGGGLGILSGIGAVSVVRWASGQDFALTPQLVGAGMVAVVSLADDLRHMPATVRLGVHVAAAVLLLWGANFPEVAGWLAGFSVLAVVWMVNLYNFMDGMDGFAGGMGAWGFGFLALCGWVAGQPDYAWSALVIAAANLGFLLCNFPPARIFMGDVGSATMGFLAAAYSWRGIGAGWLPPEVPFLIFSPFIVDATVTLVRRLIRGERVWEAHRTHYYQRLVRAGWSHRRTVLAEYGFMMGCGLTATVLMKNSEPTVTLAVLGAWGVVYGVAALLVGRAEQTGRPTTG